MPMHQQLVPFIQAPNPIIKNKQNQEELKKQDFQKEKRSSIHASEDSNGYQSCEDEAKIMLEHMPDDYDIMNEN